MRSRTTKRPVAVDVFCGVGGLSLGAVYAGFDLVGAVDCEQTVIDAFKGNFPDVPIARHDLNQVTGELLRKSLGLGKKRIDLLVGGPPCQGFSVGGIGAKRDPRNEGVLSFARLISELRPRYFVMENVRGFLAVKHANRRRKFCATVSDAGYKILLPVRALNAADYGVPQRRVRAFVIGYANGEVAPEYPPLVQTERPTVRDAIGDLSHIDHRSDDVFGDFYDGPLGPTSKFASQLRSTLSGEPVEGLSGCLRTLHSHSVVARFHATKPGSQESISRYYRLAWDGICPTLRAGTGPDHGSHTAPRPIHPVQPRCITVREAARLHTFPDWFNFHPTKWHGFRQIGNSVPPYLAKAVIAQIRKVLVQK